MLLYFGLYPLVSFNESPERLRPISAYEKKKNTCKSLDSDFMDYRSGGLKIKVYIWLFSSTFVFFFY